MIYNKNVEQPDLSHVEGFDWDEGNRRKILKRMPLDVAMSAFLGEPAVFFDHKHADDEPRWFLINRVENRYVTLIFTVRNKKIRIISARYMHKREVKKYGKKIS